MWRVPQAPPRRFARLTAAVLAFHFLVGLVMAAAPGLHHYLHPDSQADGHSCFVTVLTTGGCDAPAQPLVAPASAPGIFWDEPAPETTWVASVFQSSAVFEHAPPSLLS
jgi:hypothetical protein